MSIDKRIADYLNDLVERETTPFLPPVASRGALSGAEGYVEGPEPERVSGGGGGIASPLTEPDIEAREYYQSQLLTSSDGLFTLEVAPIKKLVMQDANSAEVVFQFADPDPEPEPGP